MPRMSRVERRSVRIAAAAGLAGPHRTRLATSRCLRAMARWAVARETVVAWERCTTIGNGRDVINGVGGSQHVPRRAPDAERMH